MVLDMKASVLSRVTKDLSPSYSGLNVGLFDVLLHVSNHLGSRTVGNFLSRNMTCRPRFEKMN